MPQQVCTGAKLLCPFGSASASLIVLPKNKVTTGNMPDATVDDHIPLDNIPTFGQCASLGNPAVANATTAAQGVLTPMPCIPATPDPWKPGSSTVTIGGSKALNNTCKLKCQWNGVINILKAGQESVDVAAV